MMVDDMQKPEPVRRAEASNNLEATKYDESDLVGVRSRVSWGALFAGAIVSLSVFLLLSTLGTAIGLSMNDWGREEVGRGATIYAIVATLISLFIGGFVVTQCTAGEYRGEGAMYGILLWGLVFAMLLTLAAQGVSTGFNAMLGVGNLAQNQATLEGVTEGVSNLSAEQRAQLEANIRQAWNQDTAMEIAWWTFAGMILSVLASIAGATLGAGPNPTLRMWTIQPTRRAATRA